MVMGRITYEAFAQFAASATDSVSIRMREIPKVVFSSTLKEPLIWKNTRQNNGIARRRSLPSNSRMEIHFDPLAASVW